LDRLVELGIDIVYLLPIHPIGKKDRKGKLGSPYSISDFYGVNPEHGTLDDLQSLLKQAHKKGLKVMMDIVFNHTSKDHHWLEDHPEYYYKNKEGNFSNRVGDWSDITDLDYTYKPLWNVMHDILVYWAKFGFDGFRCDVAPLVPVDFWIEARNKVAEVNPSFIWLAESVEKEFVKEMRELGFEVASDSELYQAFDITYDYDIYRDFEDYFKKKAPLSKYVDRLNLQEMIYPKNYLKARTLENHDQVRLMKRTNDVAKTKNWITAVFMLKGVAFLNGGIETLTDHLPDLFNKDTIDWTKFDAEWIEQLKVLAGLKKKAIFSDYDHYQVIEHDFDVLHIEYTKENQKCIVLCNVGQITESVLVSLEDGTYINEFNKKEVIVKNNHLETDVDPIIILK
jgi:glycosidase